MQLDFYGRITCTLVNIYSGLLFKGGSLYKISDNDSFWIIRCLGFESQFKRAFWVGRDQ